MPKMEVLCTWIDILRLFDWERRVEGYYVGLWTLLELVALVISPWRGESYMISLSMPVDYLTLQTSDLCAPKIPG